MSTEHHYRIFGLNCSSDRKIPFLHSVARPAGASDLRVSWAGIGPDRDPIDSGPPAAVVAENDPVLFTHPGAAGHTRILFDDGTEFLLSEEDRRVVATWPAGATIEDTATYFLGPVMARLLRRRGVLCLHAAVVGLDGGAVGFLGAAGAGKSTLAAAFRRAGYMVLSDDVMALDQVAGRFTVRPGPGHIRLWPASVAALYGSAEALPAMTPANPAWDKRYLDLARDGQAPLDAAMPLTVLYVLAERGAWRDAARFQAMAPAAALPLLLSHCLGRQTLDRAGRANEFGLVADLVSRVPVHQLTLADGLGGLNAAVRRIASSARRMSLAA
jgi:hypothetical protein